MKRHKSYSKTQRRSKRKAKPVITSRQDWIAAYRHWRDLTALHHDQTTQGRTSSATH